MDREHLPEIRALHLIVQQLQSIDSRPEQRFSASCHDIGELRQAEAPDADLVFLFPVFATDK